MAGWAEWRRRMRRIEGTSVRCRLCRKTRELLSLQHVEESSQLKDEALRASWQEISGRVSRVEDARRKAVSDARKVRVEL
eukprot:761032-Hanusia_phi.AAC.10